MVFLNQIGKKGLDVGKFLVALFSMLASAMNQPFSYPEDYISNPDSNLIGNKTLLLHLIWTVTSPNFVSRQGGSAGRQSLSGTCRGRTWRRPR